MARCQFKTKSSSTHGCHPLLRLSRLIFACIGTFRLLFRRKDASLDELTKLVKSVKRAPRHPNVSPPFSFVSPKKTGKNVLRKVPVLRSRPATALHRRWLGFTCELPHCPSQETSGL